MKYKIYDMDDWEVIRDETGKTLYSGHRPYTRDIFEALGLDYDIEFIEDEERAMDIIYEGAE
jgi:hypothetical protein